MSTPSHYQVLGLKRDASAEAIDSAYARRRDRGDAEVEAAFAVLSNPLLRQQYDARTRLESAPEAALSWTHERAEIFWRPLGHALRLRLDIRAPGTLDILFSCTRPWLKGLEARRLAPGRHRLDFRIPAFRVSPLGDRAVLSAIAGDERAELEVVIRGLRW